MSRHFLKKARKKEDYNYLQIKRNVAVTWENHDRVYRKASKKKGFRFSIDYASVFEVIMAFDLSSISINLFISDTAWKIRNIEFQSGCGKIRTRKNYVFGHFSRSVSNKTNRAVSRVTSTAPQNFQVWILWLVDILILLIYYL